MIIADIATIIKSAIIGTSTFIGGVIVSYYIWNIAIKRKKSNILNEAEMEAESVKKDKILQAKEKFLQLKSEHEKYISDRNNKMFAAESKFKQKEALLSQKFEENQRSKNEIDAIRNSLNTQTAGSHFRPVCKRCKRPAY